MAASRFVLAMASRPDPRLPIDVQGELRLDGPETSPVTLTADGSQLNLAAPGWASLHALGPRSLLAQRRTLATAIDALRTLGLTLDVSISGRRAFGLGAGIRPTLLARLLGLASIDIRFSDVFSLMRSRAAGRDADRR